MNMCNSSIIIDKEQSKNYNKCIVERGCCLGSSFVFYRIGDVAMQQAAPENRNME